MTRSVEGVDPITGKSVRVLIENDRVRAVEIIGNGGDLYLSPGLVDLQVNGYAGVDLNADVPTVAAMTRLARMLLSVGVTGFCPTVITGSRQDMLGRIEAIAAARKADPLLAAMVAGIHVEGPFIDAADGPRGAHPRAHVRSPDLAEFEAWQAAADGRIAIVTLSPHWPEAPDFIATLVARGVHVALGHTGADAGMIGAAVAAGARLSTHLGNGAAAVLPRHPNFIWAQLADDRLCASFIADGHHLPADTLTAMVRAKGVERSLLVSDSAALGGMPAGVYDSPIGGRVEVTKNGRLGVLGTPYLAGAWRNLNECVALATGLARLSLAEAMTMATRNPGRFVDNRGEIAPGRRADLIRFSFAPGDRRLDVREVWLAGERVGP